MPEFEYLTVGDAGTKLSFVDSGAPSKTPYVTIFAIHGMCFNSLIFQKVSRTFAAKGVRFVGINRRNFPGSSPYTPDELATLTAGSEQQKDAWLQARAHEIACFVDAFAQKHTLPPRSADGKTGGVVLLGWSVGASFALATVAAIHTLPADVRARLAPQLRAVIAHEPAPFAVGLPSPPKNWAPLLEESIPAELRLPAFVQWVTGYFEHGDLASRSLDALSYVLPSTVRPPSIFSMSKAQLADIVSDGPDAATDVPFLFGFAQQLNAAFHKACFDPATAALCPTLKTSFIAGEYAPSWGIAGFWAIQDADKKHGSGKINFKLVDGANHFIHWDDPEKAVDAYLACI